MNNKLRDIINDYLKDDYADIADLDEDLMDDSFDEDFDEEEEIDTVIQDITNLYNESDEETQAIIDILIEEEDGIETLVNSMYGLEEEEEDEIEEGMIGDVKTFIKKKIAGPTPAERQQKNRDVLNKHFAKQSKGFNDIIAKERAKERAKKANEEVEEELDEGMIKSIGNVFKKKVAPKRYPDTQHAKNTDHKYDMNTMSATEKAWAARQKAKKANEETELTELSKDVLARYAKKAPASKNPGPTIDQPSKLGLANPKAFAKLEKILAPKATSTKKTTKH